MRELKDYFCDYNQSLKLKGIGFNSDVLEWYFEETKEFCDVMKDVKAPLRSQALDYFMDLGYSVGLRGTTPYNWYLIDRPDKRIMSIKSGNYVSHMHCESALIDKLIELEKEARNEK